MQQGFTLDKNRELFRSFALFEGAEQSLAKTKSAKKLKSNHSRTQSFKSPNSSKFRGIQSLDQFLGIKKQSLKKPAKKDPDESRSKQSTVKTKSRLRQVADVAEITSRIVKLSSTESDQSRFEGSVLQLFHSFAENNLVIAKAEMLTILKYIFGFFSRDARRKKHQASQTEPTDLEAYKRTAKRLIVNSDQKPPADPFENNLVLLFQKEILLDEILTILNEEDIDLNNLLSITLERIEANFYEPPPDMSLNDGVSLNLEDRLKMPTPKNRWPDPSLQNRLKIDLTKIELQESESDRKQPAKPAKLAEKLDFQNLRNPQKKEAHQPTQQNPPSNPQAEDASCFLSADLADDLLPSQPRPDDDPPARGKKRVEQLFPRGGQPATLDKWSA